MKIGLFLGAGASVPFGMPTTVELRDKIRKYSQVDRSEEVIQAFLKNPDYLDIEYVLQAIRDVLKFSKSIGGEFFFSHGRGSLPFESGTLDFDQFISEVNKAEAELENQIYVNYRWNPKYRQILNLIYFEIFKFLIKNSDKVQIFTTNYDRIIEEFCLAHGNYQLIDGFERNPSHSEVSKWTGNFDAVRRDNLTNVYLFKLHGSLNWKEHQIHGIIKTNEEAKSFDSNFKRNLVVMPTLSPKDEEEIEPFKTIINEFEKRIMELDGIIVVGYSFRDIRINEIFKNFHHKNKALIALSPTSMENICKNLLKFAVPDYDENKVSSKAPVKGHVWCIPHKLQDDNVKHDLTVALAHIQKSYEDRAQNNELDF